MPCVVVKCRDDTSSECLACESEIPILRDLRGHRRPPHEYCLAVIARNGRVQACSVGGGEDSKGSVQLQSPRGKPHLSPSLSPFSPPTFLTFSPFSLSPQPPASQSLVNGGCPELTASRQLFTCPRPPRLDEANRGSLPSGPLPLACPTCSRSTSR